jgi:hypothetical protein
MGGGRVAFGGASFSRGDFVSGEGPLLRRKQLNVLSRLVTSPYRALLGIRSGSAGVGRVGPLAER